MRDVWPAAESMTERARAEATTKPTQDEIENALAWVTLFRRLHVWLHEGELSLAQEIDSLRGPIPQDGQGEVEQRETTHPVLRCFNCHELFEWKQEWQPSTVVYCPRCYARRLRR